MSPRKRAVPARYRVGRVSLFFHHGSWWLYYQDQGRQVRRKAASTRPEAQQLAAQVNAQLAINAPSLLSFTPVGVPELRRGFLDYHESTLQSSVATVSRYRAATRHLEDFCVRQLKPPLAHEVRPDAFAAYLRTARIAPNGHPHTARRQLRDKGVRFILETCRAMYAFAGKRRHLPPYGGNPFAELPLDRLKVEDAKPVFVFDAEKELAFLRAANAWAFALHLTLAKTGLRTGELVHLLIEDLDLEKGWIHVRNKTALGWRIKTGTERAVPLLPEVVAVLRRVIGARKMGPLFLRERLSSAESLLVGDRRMLEKVCDARKRESGRPLSRAEVLQVARTVWRDAGAVKIDAVRNSFIRITRAIGHPEATCPKSWRHSYATLLQDANIDPLIRQITLGHSPSTGGGLGMTTNYTHTRPETQRAQIVQALSRWPHSLALARAFAEQADPRQPDCTDDLYRPACKEVLR
jgi:integrase